MAGEGSAAPAQTRSTDSRGVKSPALTRPTASKAARWLRRPRRGSRAGRPRAAPAPPRPCGGRSRSPRPARRRPRAATPPPGRRRGVEVVVGRTTAEQHRAGDPCPACRSASSCSRSRTEPGPVVLAHRVHRRRVVEPAPDTPWYASAHVVGVDRYHASGSAEMTRSAACRSGRERTSATSAWRSARRSAQRLADRHGRQHDEPLAPPPDGRAPCAARRRRPGRGRPPRTARGRAPA